MATPRAISVGARAVAVCLTPLLLTLLPAVASAAPRTPAPVRTAAAVAVGPLDTTSRAAVAAAYHDIYLPAAAVTAPAPASDALPPSCRAGTSPTDLQDATLTLVNYVRRMSGVGSVTFDSSFSDSAQRAALMRYTKAVSPTPAGGSPCSSDSAVDGATHSNLSDTSPGAAVVRQYMDESGAGNVSVLRRSRLQRPNVSSMGSGTVGSYNALWVTTPRGPGGEPRYTTWPSSGYFPAPLEPAGRWSISPWNVDDDLSTATVAVTGPGGRPVSVATHPVTSPNRSLVFEVGTLPAPVGGSADTYTVTVSGITNRWGDTLDDYQYAVRLFDPAADAPPPPPPPVQIAPVSAPTVSGTARVGEVLTVSGATWSPDDVTTSYAWLRDGTAIPGATESTYTLTVDDVGARMSVRATGTKPGCTPGSSRSIDTAAVGRLPATLDLTASSPEPSRARIAIAVAASGAAEVGGTVDVHEGAGTPSTLPLANGAAVFDADGLAPGDHTFTVSYGGLALAVDVSAAGQPAPGGTVDVEEGSRTLQAGITVSAGTANYRASKVTPGQHTYTVHYSGTSRVSASSTTITTTVKAKATPVLKVTGSSTRKGRVTLAVAVTAPGQSALGGSVKITEGSKVRKSALTVVQGKARWTGTKMSKGQHRFTVRYLGTSQISARSVARTVKVR